MEIKHHASYHDMDFYSISDETKQFYAVAYAKPLLKDGTFDPKDMDSFRYVFDDVRDANHVWNSYKAGLIPDDTGYASRAQKAKKSLEQTLESERSPKGMSSWRYRNIERHIAETTTKRESEMDPALRENMKMQLYARGVVLTPKTYKYSLDGDRIGMSAEKAQMIDDYMMTKVYRDIHLKEQREAVAHGTFSLGKTIRKDIDKVNLELDRMERDFSAKYPGEGLYGLEYQLEEASGGYVAGIDGNPIPVESNMVYVRYDRSHTSSAMRGIVHPREMRDMMLDNFADAADEYLACKARDVAYSESGDTELWSENRKKLSVAKDNLRRISDECKEVFPDEIPDNALHENAVEGTCESCFDSEGQKRPWARYFGPQSEPEADRDYGVDLEV